jgi:hypothetical protein
MAHSPTGGLLERVLAAFSEDVLVEVSRDRVVFRCADKSVSLLPVAYLSTDAARPALLGFGDAAALHVPHVAVELFGPTNSVAGIEKHELLRALFADGMRRVLPSRTIIRPRFVLSGTQALRDILGSYEKGVLSTAAVEAGARECVFNS